MSQDNKEGEIGGYPSNNKSLEYDSYKMPPDPIDVPDVKALQTRYEYLMDTIKEKESEVSRTENSLTRSEGEKKHKSYSSYAKTMKWKKGEKN